MAVRSPMYSALVLEKSFDLNLCKPELRRSQQHARQTQIPSFPSLIIQSLHLSRSSHWAQARGRHVADVVLGLSSGICSVQLSDRDIQSVVSWRISNHAGWNHRWCVSELCVAVRRCYGHREDTTSREKTYFIVWRFWENEFWWLVSGQIFRIAQLNTL